MSLKSLSIVVLVGAYLLVMHGFPASGAVLQVPAEYATIQLAVDASVSGDTILLADGTYTGAGNKNLLLHDRGLEIRSDNGAASCVIDCESDGRSFRISGTTAPTSLRHITIRNGYEVFGGGLYLSEGSPTIESCLFENNRAYVSHSVGGQGGAMFINGGSPTIMNCVFTRNTGNGSGLYYQVGGAPTLSGCTFDSNTGIVLFLSASGYVVTECTITNNSFDGIYCNVSQGTITGCTIAFCSTAIYCRFASPLIENCLIMNNSGGSGAGIACFSYSSESPASPTIRSCQFLDNQARSGGAISCTSNCFPIIGGSAECGNYFSGNRAGIGSDLYCDVFQTPRINAQHNGFAANHLSDYSVFPQTGYNLEFSVTYPPPLEQDVYVSPRGSDANPGTNPDEPFKTIHYALSRLNASESQPLTVHLASGTYSATSNGEYLPIPFVSYVTLRSEGNVTLDCEGKSYTFGLQAAYDDESAASGLTITGCSAAIHCAYADPLIADCRLIDNYYSSGLIGAVYCYVSSPTLFNCLIAHNRYQGIGTAVYCNPGSPIIINCTIVENSSLNEAGGIYCYPSSNPVIINSIIRANHPAQISSSELLAITYSNIEGGYSGVGNLADDPLFVTGSWHEYYLASLQAGQPSDSPCLNAGADLAEITCLTIDSIAHCLDNLTTQTDGQLDQGTVDMGYHAPMPTPLVPTTSHAGILGLVVMVSATLVRRLSQRR